jgi:catechol 2,3-dioxygenase-like lactoylglutathione lyase family enzyme
MNGIQVQNEPALGLHRARTVDMKLEVVVIPVSDVDRAAKFYRSLGWRADADIADGASRILQFTPPGSPCSIIFGTHLTPSAPGSAQFLHLIVSDIQMARAQLVRNGVESSGVFHDAAGGYNRFDVSARADGPDPQRRSYASFVAFSDPDGNGYVLQEITRRFPGRVEANSTTFASAADLTSALRRAAAAHGVHEKRLGAADANWPEWYARYMVAEQTGAELPV